MDGTVARDLAFLIAVGAALGVFRAAERHVSPAWHAPIDHAPRLALLLGMAIVAFAFADDVVGFVGGLLMPIGAYKVAQVLAAPLWQRLADRRAARRIVASAQGKRD